MYLYLLYLLQSTLPMYSTRMSCSLSLSSLWVSRFPPFHLPFQTCMAAAVNYLSKSLIASAAARQRIHILYLVSTFFPPRQPLSRYQSLHTHLTSTLAFS